jgi:hypothetical protein
VEAVLTPALRERNLINALLAAYHALRSYQQGTASPALAEEVADALRSLLKGMGVGVAE